MLNAGLAVRIRRYVHKHIVYLLDKVIMGDVRREKFSPASSRLR
jgi:hypothetical protein